MPGLTSPDTDNAKIIYMGDSGHGKTGSKAALVAAGYKLRMIDTDRGFKILRSLLTDSRYPYADYMKKHGIDPAEPGRISYIPIDVPMELQETNVRRHSGSVSYSILSPASSAAWTQVVKLLNKWVDDGVDYGGVTDWDNDTVLDLDTVSTLAELAKYWNQDLNGRLGALEDDHGRDTGAAQELIRRLNLKLTSPSVRCNVIATTHITWVDTGRGVAQSISALLRDHKSVDPRGFPAIIGQALSPVFGKRWNDVFICRRTGSGASVDRRIYSVPTDNVDAKNSAYVESSYPLSTGLAEIFSALRYQEPPHELIKAVRGTETETSGPKVVSAGGFGSFGR